MRVLVPLLLLTACAPKKVHQAVPPVLDYRFEARPTKGHVAVLPPVAMHPTLELSKETHLGAGLPWVREEIRRERTKEVAALPGAIAMALPGAVNGHLGEAWGGQFLRGAFPVNGRQRLRAALEGKTDLDGTLGRLASGTGGEATLFTWVKELSADPLTAEGFPGDIVETHSGPVIVDQLDEPYRVRAEVGMALVTADGEVVMRLVGDYETLLSGRHSLEHAGRSMATSLAEEAGLVWATDPRLAYGDPGFRVSRR